MTSPYARPDTSALEELERLVEGLEAELATWRGRALKAEQELPPSRGKHGGHGVNEMQQARHRIGLLEAENQELKQRIAAARDQVERLRTRLRFVEAHDAGSAA